MSEQSFADLGVSNAVVRALSQRGYDAPFAVQRLVIEDILEGRDVLAQSPTGSGKTLAFGVSMVDLIEAESRRPAGLILAPTRELALQIVEALQPVANARALSVAVVHGGVGLQKQAKLASRAHIVVATPGRLEDLLQRGAISLKHVEILVLDEADRMLDMGFKPAVDRIVAKTPDDRQTLFFSATLQGEVGQQAKAFTHDAAKHVHAPAPDSKIDVKHRFVHVAHEDKVDTLVRELGDADRGRTLVFVRTKRGADRLVKKLDQSRVNAVAMHGNKSQAQRQKALAAFEKGRIDTLVATDVAARGIDVPDVTHVINFDAPEDRDAYTHRVGRTGRAGRTGKGVSFVLADQVRDMRKIAGDLGLGDQFESADGTPLAVSSAPPKSRPQRGGGGGGGRPNRTGANGNGGGGGQSRSKSSSQGWSSDGKGPRRRERRR
ncbi:MAG: DEAD/DEAH box helicase [Thermoleophilaceae bacterium]